MFNSKKSSISDETTSTLIGEGLNVENANITGTGTIRIDGSLVGSVNIESNLILGETGSMKGNVTVKNALIAGKMTGDIEASVSVHLSSTAVFNGNIKTRSLIIDEGAVFNGECRMEKDN